MTKLTCKPASCEPTPALMTAAAPVLAACTVDAQYTLCKATEPDLASTDLSLLQVWLQLAQTPCCAHAEGGMHKGESKKGMVS